MTLTSSELLTQQFYEWEERGRGWYFFDEPVELEPSFRPFFYHVVPRQPLDDGLHPTVFSTLVDLIRGKSSPQLKGRGKEPETILLEPLRFDNDERFKILSVSLPQGYKINLNEIEQFLIMLSYCREPISFEIIGSHTSINLQFVTHEVDAAHLGNQLKAYFPEIVISERSDLIRAIFTRDSFVSCIDFGLQDEFMRPLAMHKSFDLDPFITLFGMLENLPEYEHAVVQVLFTGTVNPWSESILRSVKDNSGDAFFLDAPEMVSLAEEKVSSPLFAVTLRVLTESNTPMNATVLLGNISHALARISSSQSNNLIALITKDYPSETRQLDILLRQSHRWGMLLNSRELATFVHLPSPSVVSYKLERDTRKTKVAPKITENHEHVLGINEHQGKEKKVTVNASQRLKHTHIIGATGTGKSTLLLNLIVQDIKNGNGICVLDPHGDLIENIVSYIPEERAEDLCIIDPADSEFPVGFNILQAHSEIEKEILSSDLVAGFRRLSMSWGDQMNSVFANAILAFLESTEGGTLADLRRFLVEKSFRDAYLKTVSDPNVIYYWQKEYPLLRNNSIGSILTRLDTFLRPKLIRNMVSQKKGLDFEALLNTKKIMLVKLSQGLIGSENSYLLGTIIVSKIHQAAMARQAQAKEERSDFFLYIDEFQNFITPSMASILSGARKYHIGLILAHQDMQQLVKHDSELASAVMSNAGTRICFRVGDTDAKRFEDGFSFFEGKDLQNLNIGEAIVRIDRPEFDFSLTTESLPAVTMNEELKNRIISRSQEKYGTPKHVIEALLKESMGAINEEQKTETITPHSKPLKTKSTSISPPENIEELTEAAQSETTEKLLKQKEQSQHRYLQTLVKRMAESRGYRTIIEEPTPDGKGRVDVGLFKNTQKLAIEISVTTEIDWEIHNIEKCLAAGYDLVVACSNQRKTLENIRNKIDGYFNNAMKSKILIFEPEQLFMYLDKEVAKEASTEKRMKGYRVKVNYDTLPDDVAKQKKGHLLKTIAKSMRKDQNKG